MSKSLRGLSERNGLDSNLFGKISGISNDRPEPVEELVSGLSRESLLSTSAILGARSFYDFLRPEHDKKKVLVCNGTACLTSGKQKDLKTALLKYFRDDEIGSVTCLGHCHTGNSFMFEHSAYSPADLKDLGTILKSVDGHGRPGFFTGTNADTPALMGGINDIHDYYSTVTRYSGDAKSALREIELSGLRGRGGAGFPFHLKLKSAGDAVSDRKYVVCNADEGDPGAYSDKWLIEERPHAVLFGMLMTGLLTGADTGVIYIRGEYPEAVRSAKDAVRQFETLDLNWKKFPGADIRFKFYVIEGAGAYICGEETSLLNSIEGLRPEVRSRPPFPSVYGLFGRPTVLSNVETFANIRYILNNGGAAYAKLGTEKSTGTKLVSLDSAFNKPGVYEVRMGTPLESVFNELGGGTRYPVKAFQIGGPLGGIVPYQLVSGLTVDYESFSSAGFLLGHAGVVSIPYEFPMIEFLLHLFEFTSAESCGKCVPCRMGSYHGSDLLKRAVHDDLKIDRELFQDLIETMKLGSLCALGGGLYLPLENAIKYFSDELEEYFKNNGQHG
jgi:NADH:ubiquinone oxidoreductase subunit F (NADH-binding)